MSFYVGLSEFRKESKSNFISTKNYTPTVLMSGTSELKGRTTHLYDHALPEFSDLTHIHEERILAKIFTSMHIKVQLLISIPSNLS